MSTIITRAGKGSALSWTEADANFTNLNTDKAELASPTFTGTPAAPTATTGTNTTQLATTAFVQGKTATQTPFAATGNIVATNVQTAIAEVDTEKVAKAGDTMTGELVGTTLTANYHQVGVSGTTTHNFTLDASAANGTMKLARESGQDIMTVDADGKPRFNQLAQSLSTNGYKVLEGGLIIQWGGVDTNASGQAVITFPVAFSTALFRIMIMPYNGNSTVGNALSSTVSEASFNIVDALTATSVGAGISTNWIALGY